MKSCCPHPLQPKKSALMLMTPTEHMHKATGVLRVKCPWSGRSLHIGHTVNPKVAPSESRKTKTPELRNAETIVFLQCLQTPGPPEQRIPTSSPDFPGSPQTSPKVPQTSPEVTGSSRRSTPLSAKLDTL